MSKISMDFQYCEGSALSWKYGQEIFKGIFQALETLGDFGKDYIEVVTAKPVFIRCLFSNVKFKIVILESHPFYKKLEIEFTLYCKELADLANKASMAIIENVRLELLNQSLTLEQKQRMLQNKIANLLPVVK